MAPWRGVPLSETQAKIVLDDQVGNVTGVAQPPSAVDFLGTKKCFTPRHCHPERRRDPRALTSAGNRNEGSGFQTHRGSRGSSSAVVSTAGSQASGAPDERRFCDRWGGGVPPAATILVWHSRPRLCNCPVGTNENSPPLQWRVRAPQKGTRHARHL